MKKNKSSLKSKKILFILFLIICLLFIGTKCYKVYEKKVYRADIRDCMITFDGNTYNEVSYSKIGNYKETNNLICKSKDGSWKIYEIEEYPNHEYVVLRSSIDAYVYEKQ